MICSKHFCFLRFAAFMAIYAPAQNYQSGVTFLTFTDTDRGQGIPIAVCYPSNTGGGEQFGMLSLNF
jgi:hypothetical protein